MASVNLSQTEATILAAFIASVVAILTIVIRDVMLENRKEQRRVRRELVEKKLTEIYSPLWVASDGGSSVDIISNRELRNRIAAHFHLLSPKMQDMFNKLLPLGHPSDSEYLAYNETEGRQMREMLPKLFEILDTDIKELQQEFNGGSRQRLRR